MEGVSSRHAGGGQDEKEISVSKQGERVKLPDIIIFNPDSYRADVLGHLDNPAAVTPNLDRLIDEGGVSYANAFAQNPVCTPSRCSFMTGWYPHVHGHRSMKNMLKLHEPSVLSVLRRAGYHVWWGGKNDLVCVEKPEDYLRYCDTKFKPDTRYRGYRKAPSLPPDDPRRGAFYGGVMEPDPDAEYHDTDRAWVEGAIDRLRLKADETPLCLYLPLHFPHPAYHVESEYYEKIDPSRLPPRIPAPEPGAGHPPILDALRREYGAARIDEQTWREVKRIYYGMCMKIDHLFGRLMNALKETGRYDNTLVVFLSDHGDFAGDYSLPEKTHATLQDALLRVPFLIKPHAACKVMPGVRSALTELVDMPATIYDLLGIDPEYTVQGHSLRDSLAGDDQEHHDAVFAEVGSRDNDTSFKNLDVLSMPPDSFYAMQSRAALKAHANGTYAVSCRTRDFKYIRRGYQTKHELYDLRSDPGECRNLYGMHAVAETERMMERRLLDFFMTTADVLPHRQDSRKV